jgi:hypothetical protein
MGLRPGEKAIVFSDPDRYGGAKLRRRTNFTEDKTSNHAYPSLLFLPSLHLHFDSAQ